MRSRRCASAILDGRSVRRSPTTRSSDPADFSRFAELDAIPVLSFQWEKPAPDTIEGARDYFGPKRYKDFELAGTLARAGARIAYGSDWPVDALNEWFALKVGVTRTNAPDVAPEYRGKLDHRSRAYAPRGSARDHDELLVRACVRTSSPVP